MIQSSVMAGYLRSKPRCQRWRAAWGCFVGTRRAHASAYQDPEFLAAVRPAVALVCVGVDNDYGHPNPGLLGRLTREGARVTRTDTGGDVATVRAGAGPAVVARGVEPGRSR
ncbi:hypothetical protein [Micromonospora sp. NPDC049282]|uniref:hypothetical protein n=1 Tax=Micromonospora sp. NPDC049282 TaxID=3364269 RepID=UPI003716DB50